MAKNIKHLQHLKSNVVENGQPKLPLSDALVEGELAVNYVKGYETISLLNSESGITRFSSDEYYTEQKLGSGFTGANSANTVTKVIEDNELIVSSALNDLEIRKLDASAYTPTDLSNYYTKSETSGATEISNALGSKVNSQTFISHTSDTTVHVTSAEKEAWDVKADESWVEEKLGSAFTGANSANTVTKVISDDERVIAAALVYLNSNKLDVSAYTPTDLSGYYTKTNIDDKLGSAFTGVNSGVSVTQAIVDNEMAVESALTTLHDDIEELSSANYAYLSNDSGAGIVPGDGIRAEVVESSSAISVNPDVITIISGSVGEATITLEVPEDILAHVWDIMLETSSAPNITIAMSNSATIHYPLGYATNPSVNIELSIVGVGDKYYLRYGEFA